MNKIFFKLSKLNRCLVLIFCLLALESYSQCSVTLTSVRDTIACGETLDIETIGLGGLQTDDFTANTLSGLWDDCLLYTSPSPRDPIGSRMPSSA